VSQRQPTPEQAAAIEAEARSVMVEAGAGTGKTGTMVDRYCRVVCDQGVSPDAVLAFTFTEKAAAELRERIRAAVAERAAAGSERARELVPALGGAWVTTIHGFCNRLLAAHPVAAGIDPRFRVLDATEAERTAGEAFELALEEFLAGGDASRERLVATYDVAGLRALAIGVHAELRSRGEAELRLPEQPSPDVAAALRRAAAAAADALAELKPSNGQRELVERAAELLGGAAAPGLDALAALRTKQGGEALAGYREAVEALVSRAAEAGEGGEAYRDFAALLKLFSERFAAAKERRAGLDFEDLQLLAVRLLENEAGAFYRERFEHLLVDEFQDTNRLQLRLIEVLRGPRTRLMVVGDELQSIYGFRHADLDVFRERRESIGADPDGEVLPLSGNFRSRPEAIGAVNALGERLLGEAYRPLRVGAAPVEPEPPGGGGAVELLLTGHDGWEEEGIDLEPATDARTPKRFLAEARALAARLRELADAGVPRGSMVVLLRAYTHLDAHEDSLERAGLRPYVVGGRGYWSQQQVADVCALLATIANPLDDQALLGALASPACGASPDSLWLLRAAAGRERHLWPALERAVGASEEELEEPELLEAIPGEDLELLGRFATTLRGLRRRAPLLSLPGLIEAAVGETGYDLAVLMRHAGEARFANVRKLMRMAAEFEAAEGRDLRGLLDFLAARAGADADPQAASAVEGHDGVRIMTVHSAKGLEFDVVAVPGLSRGLLAASRTPPLAIGREAVSPRVGMQLRRLGAGAIDLYEYRALCDEEREREASEELRLFHVAATRARERLILSGVIRSKPPSLVTGTSVVERIAAAFDLDRERDSEVTVPAPAPRDGLDASFPDSAIAVRVSLASSERAAELTAVRPAPQAGDPAEAGPAPLVPSTPPPRPAPPLSYTAIDERLGGHAPARPEAKAGELDRELAAARGIAAHALLEWSHANAWAAPPAEAIERIVADAAAQKGVEPAALAAEDALAPLRAWRESPLFAERIAPGAARTRVEVPLLMQLAGRTIRGSIDLLAEEGGRPPLIVDYKTDRLGELDAAAKAEEYETQRDLYALAVAEATGADAVEVAYVFLERPADPAVQLLEAEEIAAGKARLEEKVARVEELPGSESSV
jgi:ATP-dependent helicase/nuclease subunit A